MKINIITNTFEKYHRQDVAVESWKHLMKLYPDVVRITDYQFFDEPYDPKYDIDTRYKLEHSSKDWVHGATKKLPLVFEIMMRASEDEDVDYFIFTNSDVILMPNLIDLVLKNEVHAMAISRLDIEDIDSFANILNQNVKAVRYETFGSDVFVFRASWFRAHMELFDANYLMGMWKWDNVYAGLVKMLCPETPLGVQIPPFAFHIHHGLDSVMKECPEKEYNEGVLNQHLTHKMASDIMGYYLNTFMMKRPDAPRFLFIPDREQYDEIQYFKQFEINYNRTYENRTRI